MQKAKVPPYRVLRARRPHATGNGARKFACRDGVCCAVRDRRAILVYAVPVQHERLIDPVLGLEVRSQRGGREVREGALFVCYLSSGVADVPLD